MAARKHNTFYVYAIMDGPTCLYVGKGSGRRAEQSARIHGGEAKIIRSFAREDDAFAFERELISELLPANNKCAGGNGGRKALGVVPVQYRGKLTECDMKRAMAEHDEIERGMFEIGPRRYVARMLLGRFGSFIDPSKVDAIRQVAYGCRS